MKDYDLHERTIAHILPDKARANGEKVFIYFKDRKVAYRQVEEAVNRLANGFLRLGVSKGDKVCLMLPNCPEYVFLWWALAKIGAIEVPINTGHRGELFQYVINNSEARVLVIDRKFLDVLAAAMPNLPALEKVIVLDGQGAALQAPPSLPVECLAYEHLIDAPGDPPNVEVSYTDLVSIMYTSGTTGASKGVVRAMNHDYYIARTIAQTGHLKASDIFHTSLPYFHGISQFMVTLPALLADASVVISESFSASGFLNEIRRYRATATFFVTSMAHTVFKQRISPDDGDNPLRLCYIIGAPSEIYEDFERRFACVFVDILGSTESNAIVVTDIDARKPGAVGKVHPGFDVRIFDDEDEEVPPGTIGEIVCRPREAFTTMVGYYKMPQETMEAFRNLWFHSGDLGYVDEHGYFYFAGRKKDAIRRRGENISAYELEQIVNLHPDILESAAVGVPSALGEEDVKIVVVPRPGKKLDPAELISFCEARMAEFMVPRYVEIADALPETSTQKVEKRKLKGVTPGVTWDRANPDRFSARQE